MTPKDTAARQYRSIVDQAAGVRSFVTPKEGWGATVRKALGMPAVELARRLNVTRASVFQAEKAELSGGVTLRKMQETAEAMGCRFVYAIVPADGRVEDLIAAQARKKAEALVRQAGVHMALERQSLPAKQMVEEVARIADDLARKMPSDFWADT